MLVKMQILSPSIYAATDKRSYVNFHPFKFLSLKKTSLCFY